MARGMVRSALLVGVVLAGTLLLFQSVCGDNPSLSECRPHIDATIRNLAAKAIVAGEQPPSKLDSEDYAPAEAEPVPPAPEPEVVVAPEPEKVKPPKIKRKTAPPPPEPAQVEKPKPKPPAPEPPVVHEEPPVVHDEPPVVHEAAPVVHEAAPVVHEEPPVVHDEPPVVHEEPPVVVDVPPPPPPAPAAPATPSKEAESPSTAEAATTEPLVAKHKAVPEKEAEPEPVEPTEPSSAKKTAQSKPTPKDEPTGIINRIVGALFGLPKSARDPKWAKPWQTHPEFAKKPAVVKAEEKKPTHVASGGIIDYIVKLIFPTVPEGTKRDPKWSKPWQTHEEFAKKSAAAAKQEEKKPAVGASGGIIDFFVKLVFPTVPEGTKRDPKWAKPWQTHPEFSRKSESAQKPVEKKAAVAASGGIIDFFVKLIFSTAPEGTKRDPKYSKPWQSHPEFARKSAPAEVEVKRAAVRSSGGIIDSFVKILFTTPSSGAERDPKWAKPWQTHPEFAKKSESATKPVEKKVAGASGGILDSLIKLIFPTDPTVTKRDPKWAQPWQTHDEHRKGGPVIVKAPEPVKKPELAPEPKPSPPPVHKPEPAVILKPEPAPVPEAKLEPAAIVEPAPASKTEPAPKEASAPIPKKEPAPKPVAEEATFPKKDVAGKGTAPAAAPVGAQQVADAPQTVQQPVLVKESQDKAPAASPASKEEEEQIVVVPTAFRSRDQLEAILGLDETSKDAATRTDPIAESTLKDLKKIYEASIRPMESLYKYQDISNRQVSDAEFFGTPLILLVGPYSTGKSSFINYLMGVEYTKRALKTGTPPSHGVFRVVQYGEKDSDLDGTDLSAHPSFTSLQKFGQNFIDQLSGKALRCPLLKKATFVETPGILEMRRPGERLYPYNDVVQWFIDRADLILVMFDYTKLDAGYELEAILDQLKGREAQTRILLNKADQVPPEELIKVQGSLFWNLSPLLGVSTPPTVYAGSFASRPYRPSSPAKLFQAQEEALLTDIAKAMNSRVDNRIAIARRHAVRVRNHAHMVDTYLTTFYKNKGFLTSKHKLAEDIIENPHTYNIYEGMSLLSNISRYDLPDPEIYRDFFRVHNLYDFQTLKDTCSYFRGCPLTKIDNAISKELPDLLERYRRLIEAAAAAPSAKSGSVPVPTPGVRGSVTPASHTQTS